MIQALYNLKMAFKRISNDDGQENDLDAGGEELEVDGGALDEDGEGDEM